MPQPVEHNRHVVTQLKPMIGTRNLMGNRQLFQVVFNLPGPAAAIPCDHFELPFDVRFELMSITWRVGGDGTTILMHGLESVGLEGPYTGPVHPTAVEPTNYCPRETLVYPEITTFDEADEGVVICFYGSPLASE